MGHLRFVLAAALFAAAATPAFAAGGQSGDQAARPASTLTISYDMFIMGLPLGNVDLSARIQDGSYQSQVTLDTKGFISIFWQSHIESQSNGRVGPGALRPALYDSHARNRSKRQHVTVSFGPQGPTGVQAEPPYPKKYPVSDEQRRGTVDPLSAFLFVATGITATPANPCGTAAPVFDGRRRYNIELVYVKTKNVQMDNGAYTGPALVCQIKYIQIAGFKQEIIAEGKKLPAMFAWLVAMPGKTNPSQRYLIPVRLWANTQWGTAEAEVSRVQLDSQIVAQETN